MDTGTDATVSEQDGGVSREMPNGRGGEAGSGLSTKDFDELLTRRLAEFRGDVVKEASEQSFRGMQRVVDQRFSRIEPVIGQLPQINQRLNELGGYFQNAQEADLDPDEKRNRDTRRQLDETARQRDAAMFANRVYAAHGQVMRVLNRANIAEDDPRILSMWNEDAMKSNPEAWATQMASDIAQLRIADAEAKTTRQSQAQQDAERRRNSQLDERQRVENQNANRAALGGRIETATPQGTSANWHEKWLALRAAGDYKGAAKIIEANAKRVTKSGAKTPDQLD